MKILFPIAFILFFVPARIEAQTFGLRGGLNFATQRFNSNGTIVTPPMVTRSHLGIFINSQIGNKTCVQVEFGYNGMGSKADKQNSLPSSNYDYVTGAVLFKYYPHKAISFHIGPQVGFLFGGKYNDSGNSSVLDRRKQTDILLALGSDLFLNRFIGIGIRYDLGLNNIYNFSAYDIKQYNRVIQLSLLFRIPGYQFKESGY